MLFLMAAGMTLMLGVMNVVNLAYGALYMLGAYFAVTLQWWTGSFVTLAALGSLAATATVGILMETAAFRHLYLRSYLDQVLCTIGLNMFLNELVRVIWGPRPLHMALPPALAGTVEIMPGLGYPILRLAIIGVGLVICAGLYLLIAHTKIGIQFRAGASNRAMAGVMGINIKVLFTLIFALGAALAGLQGSWRGRCLGRRQHGRQHLGLDAGRHRDRRHRVGVGCADRRDHGRLYRYLGADAAAVRARRHRHLSVDGGVLYLKPRGLFPATT